MESRAQEIKAASNRKTHNEDLIKRYRNGDSLCAVDGKSTWFPPRPIIEKDADAIKKLYGDDSNKKAPRTPRRALVLELGHQRGETSGPADDGDSK